MIPIDPEATFQYFDEKDEITYHFKYLLGDMQEEFSDLFELVTNLYTDSDKVSKEIEGLSDEEKDQREDLQEKAKEYERALIELHRRLIDLFLVKWESTAHRLPELTTSPSSQFLPGDLADMAGIIISLFPELTRPKSSEIKNSSRQRSSRSKASTTGAKGARKRQKKTGDA